MGEEGIVEERVGGVLYVRIIKTLHLRL